MEEQTVDTSTKEVQQETQPAGAPTDLNVNDLAAIKSIIEISSQRGTFKAAEMEAVGKIYNKLNNFLEAVTKKD